MVENMDNCLRFGFNGPVNVVQYTLPADMADYLEVRGGSRNDGFATIALSFGNKVGTGVFR